LSDPAAGHRPHFGTVRTGRHLFHVHAKTTDHMPGLHHPNRIIRFNARAALICVAVVGSMWCAYAFAAEAIWGLPTAMEKGGIGFPFWFASDFLQLVLLSVIIVGTNLLGVASDARAAKTFADTEALRTDMQEARAALATALDRLDTGTEGGLADVLAAITGLRTAITSGASAERLQPTWPPRGKDGP
jgi:hypothetical protein